MEIADIMLNQQKLWFALVAFLIVVSLQATAQAANDQDIKKLLATKECSGCDLSDAGLVMANLSGADLSGANLSGANLSRANLTGANLTGANLTGASLYGVNLIGAKILGANLAGTDLRDAYLTSVDFTQEQIAAANLQGATGITVKNTTPEDFYNWGITEAEKGNLKTAIDDFSQAIAMKPNYANAYFSRGVAHYQSLDRQDALIDALSADKLFISNKDPKGHVAVLAFIKELKTPYKEDMSVPKPTFFDFVNSLGSFLLPLLPF